ncbi:Methyltransferase domain family protein [gamma proteobacterium NOR5-3]|nr:Methyltransferase domain family protein [gamma proteobacterium NOR5-3]
MAKNTYEIESSVARSVAQGNHREAVGGLWQHIGELQLEVLKSIGLKKSSTLLDVGCGSLRGGCHFVEYLEPGNYFGIDINESLINAGYDKELTTAAKQKLPRENLQVTKDFRMDMWNKQFDFAVAISVFTHMPMNDIRLCLAQLEKQLLPGGKFCATFFEAPSKPQLTPPLLHAKGGITTFANKDPYHYLFEDFVYLSQPEWQIRYLGDLDHPRSQKFIEFTKK